MEDDFMLGGMQPLLFTICCYRVEIENDVKGSSWVEVHVSAVSIFQGLEMSILLSVLLCWTNSYKSVGESCKECLHFPPLIHKYFLHALSWCHIAGCWDNLTPISHVTVLPSIRWHQLSLALSSCVPQFGMKLIESCVLVPDLLTYFLGVPPPTCFCNSSSNAMIQQMFVCCHDTCRITGMGVLTLKEGKVLLASSLISAGGNKSSEGPELVIIIV